MADNMTPAQVPYEAYRAAQANDARMQAAELQMDTAPAGGRYMENGRLVDANGNPVKKAEAPAPEAAADDPYKDMNAAEMKAAAEERGLDAGTSKATALAALQADDAAKAQG